MVFLDVLPLIILPRFFFFFFFFLWAEETQGETVAVMAFFLFRCSLGPEDAGARIPDPFFFSFFFPVVDTERRRLGEFLSFVGSPPWVLTNEVGWCPPL